jgi:LmbE family N-acetylglucosaminyl deacetylase
MAIPVPDVWEAKRILAIQPHYDDNDIAAGGSLAALAAAGVEVDYLTVTDDLVGVHDATLSAEEATVRLRSEQERAGAEVGVRAQYWLGFPDAGDYDHHTLRREIIRYIRMLRPDFLFSVDPWLPYESHGDHLKTGRAVTEAALLYGFPRLATDPEIDRGYQHHTLIGVVLYFTLRPNRIFDISGFRERKHRAIDAYRAQLTPESLEQLHRGLDWKERDWAQGKAFSHGEALKVLSPAQLHCGLLPVDE